MNKGFELLRWLVMVVAICCISPANAAPPYRSWANIKLRFGAVGNGVKDDTDALQSALDSLTDYAKKFNSGNRAYTVVYLPKGKYRITRTLNLRGKLGIMIVGESRNETTLVWDGKASDTMLLANGSAYFKITELTFDAAAKKDIECLGVHWINRWNTAASQSYSPSNIELSNLRFIGNPKFGISGGTISGTGTGQSDSEVTIRNCDFDNATEAGIRIAGYNALDYWIWNCNFRACKVGVSNSFGNYHVYASSFEGSVVADVFTNNGYYSSIRNCVSRGSNAFSLDDGYSTNPFKRVFEGNDVSGIKAIPIQFYHVGGIALLNNRFDKPGDTSQLILRQKSAADIAHALVSVNNTFGVAKPIQMLNNKSTIYASGNNTGLSLKPAASKTLQFRAMALKTAAQTVYEVPAGSNWKFIQELINSVARKGKAAIIHFGCGVFEIDQPLVVPARAAIAFTGDGQRSATVIAPASGFRGIALFQVSGPTKSSFSDIQLGTGGARKLAGIRFNGIDQPASAVLMDQIYCIADTSVWINGLDYTYFEKNNSFYADGNVVSGGKRVQQGKGTMRMTCFGGQYARVQVLNNAQFVAKDCWWEGGVKKPLVFSGSGTVLIDGAKIAPNPMDSLPIVDVQQFNGKITLMNMYLQGGLQFRPANPGLSFLLLNTNFYYKKDLSSLVPAATSAKVALVGLTSQCFYENDPECKTIKSYADKTIGIKGLPEFISDMTEAGRTATPMSKPVSAAGATQVIISRVTFESLAVALSFHP